MMACLNHAKPHNSYYEYSTWLLSFWVIAYAFMHYHVPLYVLAELAFGLRFFLLIEASYIGSVSLFASDAFLNRVSLFNLTENMTPEQRRENYSCDITYVTNSELGFDYLRDNLAMVCVFLCWELFVIH